MVFKLLWRAFGTEEYCNGKLQRRAERGNVLMKRIGELEDPQAALLLLRHCTGYARVFYSARTVPPAAQAAAMGEYGVALREALEAVAGRSLDERGWSQAQLGILEGGLGLRLPEVHGGAAYAASVGGSLAKVEEVLHGRDEG